MIVRLNKCQRKQKGLSMTRMDKLVTLSTLGTHDTGRRQTKQKRKTQHNTTQHNTEN